MQLLLQCSKYNL